MLAESCRVTCCPCHRRIALAKATRLRVKGYSRAILSATSTRRPRRPRRRRSLGAMGSKPCGCDDATAPGRLSLPMRIRVSQMTAAWRRRQELHCRPQSKRQSRPPCLVSTVPAHLIAAEYGNRLPPAPWDAVLMRDLTRPTAHAALLGTTA